MPLSIMVVGAFFFFVHEHIKCGKRFKIICENGKSVLKCLSIAENDYNIVAIV